MSQTNQPCDLVTIDADIFCTPEYESIFSRGIVVKRNTDNEEEISLVSYMHPLEKIEPLIDTDPNPAKLHQVSSSTLDYFIESTDFSTIQLIKHFNTEFPTRYRTTLTIGPLKIDMPTIKSHQVMRANKALSSYIDRVKQYLDVSYFKNCDHYINVNETITIIDDLVSTYIAKQTKVNPIAYNFLTAILLERAAISSDYNILRSISKITTISDDNNTYQISTEVENCFTRSSGMALPSTIIGSPTITYSLNRKQIDSLVQYIFTSKECLRMDCKIHLLSTTHSNVRTDLISNPGQVLVATFAEYLMTPSEVINIIFCRPDNPEKRCPVCNANISHTDNRIKHHSCNVFQWIKKYMPILIVGDEISSKPLRSVSTPIHKRLNRLFDIKAKIQNHNIETTSNTGKHVVYSIKDDNSLLSKYTFEDRTYKYLHPNHSPNTRSNCPNPRR